MTDADREIVRLMVIHFPLAAELILFQKTVRKISELLLHYKLLKKRLQQIEFFKRQK